MFYLKKTKIKPFLLPAFLFLFAVFLISGCGSSVKVDDTGNTGMGKIPVYTIGDSTGDWGYPTPYAHYQRGPGYILTSYIFDTLIWKDEKGFVPALAKKWEFIDSENAYYFELNEKAQWHDGQKVTARDVAFTVEYTKKHPYMWADTRKISKVEVIDDNKLKIHLSQLYAPFLNNIAGVLPILPEHIWKDVQNPTEFKGNEAVIGTGPFKLVDYNKEQGMYLFEANENYYLGTPKVDRLKFVKVKNEVVPAALQRGEINIGFIPPEIKDQMVSKDFKIIKGKYDWVQKLAINHKKEPLNSKKFRLALCYLINRNELINITKRGYALPGSQGLLSSESEWYNDKLEGYHFNPDKSREILETLGYRIEKGYYVKDGKELKLELLVKPEDERDGQFIKQQLEKGGIKVELKTLEWKTMDARVSDWQFDLAVLGHGMIGGDPEIMNKMILGKSFMSARYDGNKALNALLKEQMVTMNPEERKEKVKQIQKLYAEEMPGITLYYPDWYWAHDGKVEMFNAKWGIGYGIPLPLNKLAFIR